MGWAKLIYIVLAHVATCHLHACLYLITEALACVIQALYSYECNVGMISDGEISGNTWFWHVFGCLQTNSHGPQADNADSFASDGL